MVSMVIEHAVAFVEDQVTVVELPEKTVDGEADMARVGAGPVGMVVLVVVAAATWTVTTGLVALKLPLELTHWPLNVVLEAMGP